MKSWVTGNGLKLYQVLGGRSNSFLVSNGERHLLIDTGRENSWKKLIRSLDEIRVDENSLSALILTHTHFDHAENAYNIKEKYKTMIIVHKSEADLLRCGKNPEIKGSNPVTGCLTGIFGMRAEQAFGYKPIDSDIAVEDNYDLNGLGFNAYIIHTPGHTPGSISIIIDNEIAIVGDAMFGIFRNSVFPPFASEPENMVRSWKRLIDTGCSLFIPAHGTANSAQLLRGEYEKYIRKYSLV